MKLCQRVALAAGFLLCSAPLWSQTASIKTNLLGWATTNVNLGAEFGVARKSTIQVFGSLNPWEFGDEKHFHAWVVEPEYRYWFCEKFNGHFIGVHLLGGQYNAKNMNFPLKSLIIGSTIYDNEDGTTVNDKGWPDLTGTNAGRHAEGWFAGAGITYGYQWMLSKHWNLEASIGVGYAYSQLTFYGRCDRIIDKRKLHYVGPTKAAVSIMYMF